MTNKGYKQTEEHKNKISKALINHLCYKNIKRNKKISKANKGKHPWNYHKKGVQIAWNKNLTAKTDERIRKNVKGFLKRNKEIKGKSLIEYYGKEKALDIIKRNSINHKRDKHWNWQDGKSFEIYPEDFSDELREYIRKKYNYRCQCCKKLQEKLSRKLHIHHIDINKNNNDIKNLIPLCNSCHVKTHNEKI